MKITTIKQYVKFIFEYVFKGAFKRRPLQTIPKSPISHILRSNFTPNFTQIMKYLDGKLLLRDEIPLQDAIFQKLLTNNYFYSYSGIYREGLINNCQRCHNDQREFFGEIPCLTCKKTHLYCRKCINMGRVKACDLLYYWTGPLFKWPKVKDACSWQGKLTKSQLTAANAIEQAIENNEEKLIWAVTGSGKTEMLFPGISLALAQGKRVCLATPRADVVRELLPRLQSAFQHITIQGLFGGSHDKDGTAQLVLATTHQLLRYKEAFDVLIIDEIDAFPYHNDTSLQASTMRAAKKNSALIYLTATPRERQKMLIKQGKLKHVFVPIRYHEHPLILPQLIYTSNLKGQLASRTLSRHFVSWLDKRKNRARQILIFVPTITLANQLTEPIRKLFIQKKLIMNKKEVARVHAADNDRAEKIALFRKQTISVLITTTILERGVTFPAIDVVVLDAGHIVFDEPALIQIAGRAGRSTDDPRGEVMFFHDGKTDAMMETVNEINQMNKRAKRFLLEAGKDDC